MVAPKGLLCRAVKKIVFVRPYIHSGVSGGLVEITDPSIFGATEGTVGVACKCFGVCMTLLGQPNPNHTRSVSQTRIFRKPVRYTISGGVLVQK